MPFCCSCLLSWGCIWNAWRGGEEGIAVLCVCSRDEPLLHGALQQHQGIVVLPQSRAVWALLSQWGWHCLRGWGLHCCWLSPSSPRGAALQGCDAAG